MVVSKISTAKINSSVPNPYLHPPYFQMISEAITTMKDRTGSSQPAIAKFIEENYTKMLPKNFKKMLSIQLKRFVKSEKLVKVKNSYKIAAAEKAKKASNTETKISVSKKTVEKAQKTKRLSQVKTPEALKKKTKIVTKRGSAGGEKVKKTKAVTPVKRKSVKTGSRASKTSKKAKN